jgi:hypothetical protein
MRILLITVFAMVFSLSGCSSQKKLAKTAPFEMGQVTCQSWTGGRAESGSGIKLEIPVLSENMDNMKMQQAFFRGKVADISMNTIEGKCVISYMDGDKVKYYKIEGVKEKKPLIYK